MNNKERLSRLIAQYQKNMEFYRNAREFNEQDCRDEFISPLLESFGWDVHNEKGTSPQYKRSRCGKNFQTVEIDQTIH